MQFLTMPKASNFLEKIILLFQKIQNFITEKTEDSGRQIVAFGIILTINYPLYYFIWLYASSQSYENLLLRISASFFCSLLIFKDYWPKKLKPYLPVYWYFTAAYSLPFFFVFMLLKNHASTMWLMNSVSALFFLLLLFDLLSVFIILIIGISSGWFLYNVTSSSPFTFMPGLVNFSGVVATFAAAFVIGAIFAHNKERLKNEKLRTIVTIGESIAHELRTPLRTISAGASGIKKYLPLLIETYQIAKKENLPIPRLDAMHYEALGLALSNIESEAQSAFNFISMLLMNANHAKIDRSYKICSMADCIDQALSRYPFDHQEKELISWKHENNFQFVGDELLMVHVLFNLFKNALYFIKAAGKGNITIWLENGKKYNILHFRDTGEGVPAKILPHVFERFFSKTQHGTGIGLAFCKLVLKSFDGDIICQSKEGEYAEFALFFPKLSVS